MYFSRTLYCPTCFKEHRPRTGQKFVVFGNVSQIHKVYRAKRIGEIGYTPHIVRLESIDNCIVTISVFCGMHMCGCDLIEKDGAYVVRNIFWEKRTLTEISWKALLEIKDIGYYI